ncbi:hypothetical protein DFH06DRAFT_1345723 [Mycena polygramma]|nr:hypothetical protein DFH06DRAFT_1345723 [Mycena polygramma]
MPLRSNHGTSDASESEPEQEKSIRREILRKFHEILKEDRHARAPGTAVERQVRIGATTGTGNAANAAAVASAAATKAATRRAKLFKEAKVPQLPLISAGGVSKIQKLAIGDFGIVWTETGLRVAQVQAMYSKGGGKYGKHNNIDDHINLSGISNLGAQVYEPFQGQHFRAITEATASLQTKQFRLLPSFTFLYRLSSAPKTTPSGIELSAADLSLFQELSRRITSFDSAVKQSRSRKKQGADEDGEEEDN